MARSRKHDVELSVEDIEELEEYFKEYAEDMYSDDYFLPTIKKLNDLLLPERRLMIIYLLCKENAVIVSEQLGCSVSSVRCKINKIKTKLR